MQNSVCFSRCGERRLRWATAIPVAPVLASYRRLLTTCTIVVYSLFEVRELHPHCSQRPNIARHRRSVYQRDAMKRSERTSRTIDAPSSSLSGGPRKWPEELRVLQPPLRYRSQRYHHRPTWSSFFLFFFARPRFQWSAYKSSEISLSMVNDNVYIIILFCPIVPNNPMTVHGHHMAP